MPYTKGANNATGPYIAGGTQTYQQANNAEYQYDEATQSIHSDILTPFVESGLVATKDGTTASQLDVTAGVAFVLQADSTLRRRAPTSSTQSTTGHPSTTMFLDLQPDGTWSFATTHSAQSGYLPIASVTTDGSANISTVTDARTLNTTLWNGAAGTITLHNGAVANLVSQNAGKSFLANDTGSGLILYPNTSSYTLALQAVNGLGAGKTGLIINTDGSAQVGLPDNSGAGVTIRLAKTYEGTTDPVNYTTPNEGDIWFQG